MAAEAEAAQLAAAAAGEPIDNDTVAHLKQARFTTVRLLKGLLGEGRSS